MHEGEKSAYLLRTRTHAGPEALIDKRPDLNVPLLLILINCAISVTDTCFMHACCFTVILCVWFVGDKPASKLICLYMLYVVHGSLPSLSCRSLRFNGHFQVNLG